MKALSLLLLTSQIRSERTLEFVFELFRHGARTPVIVDEMKTFHEEPGMLTPMGMREHNILGVKERKRYIDQLQFLDPELLDT